jgi:hypothetical protein
MLDSMPPEARTRYESEHIETFGQLVLSNVT